MHERLTKLTASLNTTNKFQALLLHPGVHTVRVSLFTVSPSHQAEPDLLGALADFLLFTRGITW